MSDLTNVLTNITPPRVPLTDQRTGLISREWYRFFLSLFTLTGAGQNYTSLTDLQVGPPVLQVDEINHAINKLTENVSPLSDGLLSQIAEMQKQIEGLSVEARLELGTLSQLQQNNVPWLTFDNTPQSMPTNVPGTLYWDEADGNQTLNLVMAGGLTTQQIGEEQYYRIKASSAITEGQVIMFTGTVGASGALKGAPATGLTAATSLYVMGVATENIANNGWGYVTSFGLVRGINTTGGAEAWVDGQILYLNPAVAGGLTKTVPVAPNPKVVVAAVVQAASNGSLFIRPAFGGRLGDFEGDVNISSPVNGDLLIYDAVQGRWENATLTAGTNVSITNGAGSITINSSNPGGTVTSVGLSAPTGFSVSGSPVTSSGTLALSFSAGYSLPTTTSQSNWDTAYTDRLKWDGGSTGLVASTGRTSLGATTVGSNLFTLTNPNAITFLRVNADNTVSALDAAAFRTAIGAGAGTVTSVSGSGGTTGLTLTGGPITTSGTLTLGGTLIVGNGGTGVSIAGIAAFNNITGYTASGATGTTSTNLVFSTSPSITTPTLVGDANLSTGNITQGTASKGINFTANSAAAGKTSQLLNWYEEGTWTPVLGATTTNPTVTYGIQRARYTRIGRLVTLECSVTWSAISGGSGNVVINGFPYTINSSTSSNGGGSISYFDGFTLSSGRTAIGMLAVAGTTYGQFTCMGSAVSTQYISIASVAASGFVSFTLTYSV